MLGYGIDPDCDTLQTALASYRESRRVRAGRIIDRLRELGVDLPEGSVKAPEGDASIGRPHIARAMIESGYVQSVSEAFERYLGDGKPAYIASERKPTPVEAIRLILAAGGLPIHAHPFSSDEFPATLPDLIAAGLAGIEVYYAEYTPEQRQDLARIAAEYGVLATGGSDYHGERFKERRDLGSVALPAEVLQRFLARLDAQPTH
jgi:predicted metal-dependent phosphoesterase TrpH